MCLRSPLATISVEGRTDEILRLPHAGDGEAVLLPMAVATVVEETLGVRRYQVLQTAPDVLTVRLDHDPRTDRVEVWQRVRAGLADLLRPTVPSMSSCSWRPNRRRQTRAAETPARAPVHERHQKCRAVRRRSPCLR